MQKKIMLLGDYDQLFFASWFSVGWISLSNMMF